FKMRTTDIRSVRISLFCAMDHDHALGAACHFAAAQTITPSNAATLMDHLTSFVCVSVFMTTHGKVDGYAAVVGSGLDATGMMVPPEPAEMQVSFFVLSKVSDSGASD